MPATPTVADTSVVAILSRLLSNSPKRLTPALARHILSLGFSDADKARVHDLAVRNQDGALTPAEKQELLNFAQAGDLLASWQSKARQALKQRKAS